MSDHPRRRRPFVRMSLVVIIPTLQAGGGCDRHPVGRWRWPVVVHLLASSRPSQGDLVAYVRCAIEQDGFVTPNRDLYNTAKAFQALPPERQNFSPIGAKELELRLAVIPLALRRTWSEAKLRPRKTGKRSNHPFSRGTLSDPGAFDNASKSIGEAIKRTLRVIGGHVYDRDGFAGRLFSTSAATPSR